jgi:hypothetical protein
MAGHGTLLVHHDGFADRKKLGGNTVEQLAVAPPARQLTVLFASV